MEIFKSRTEKEHRRRIRIGRMMSLALNMLVTGICKKIAEHSVFVRFTLYMLYFNKKVLMKVFSGTTKACGGPGLTVRQQWQSWGAGVQL